MEKNFNRLFCALLGLGLSTPIFASSAVVVPSQHGGFKVGVDVLYLRPTNSDLGYGIGNLDLDRSRLDNQKNLAVNASYAWGFYVQAGYLIPCTGNDVNIGYTYLHSQDTAEEVDPIALIFIEPLQILDGLGLAVDGGITGNASANFDLNAVDLELGQRLTSGAYDIRAFAGLRYADIEHSLSADQFVGLNTGSVSETAAQEFTSHYRGIGPRIGVDGRYCLRSGFGLDADLSTSLLVGKIDAKYNALNDFGIPGTPPLFFQANNGSRTRIVPVLEAKLGADYTHIVNRCSKSVVIFEGGYQMTNYYNTIDHAQVVGRPIFRPALISTTDMAFHGPYVGIKYYA